MKGKTILITGGGSGIGEAFANILSNDNKVVICGRNEDKLKRVAATSENISYYVADVSVPDDIDHLFKQMADKNIVLDVLFNNAGVVEQFEVLKAPYSSAQIFGKVNTNLSGAIAITQLFINQANQSAANLIVNMSTGLAIFPAPILALYAASKTGFSVFTKTLRQQLSDTNFRVIEILPPHVETDMPKQIGNMTKGQTANDFANKTIRVIDKGKLEYAPGFNMVLLKLFRKFLPETGLKIVDKVTRKQWQGE
ncbi:SDR family NAD(P)-dependent oxidoreductase [Chitinophaga pinensis]|uniref:Short-chain dehydrogenase/reductase SDR n=1 Tax=Chitinophaga pinensis (strain ATCC 43595 / DSM 2588 / LMG 13176 / NBRC 15968 / NCIMB 11800 / UQM 2034) TaxID=485918 RepID=A0A979GC77_CHIPD|nr:SDR family NAD(P)-dependent oxidoreductase [Chitinophaga pinensis]ACU64647.1 short-chain dehydrogenase/reductase SDR [Chitinophaga pinensis DSM 2588]